MTHSTYCRVEQCEHILGVDYMTVVSCRYNRQSFIHCCSRALAHFPPEQPFSVRDFYSLLQLVCPDIPLSLIQDSALTGCTPVSEGSAGQGQSALYLHHELSTSLFFRFIFTEWLIMLENLFFEGRTRTATVTVPPDQLKTKFAEWSETLAERTSQPSLSTLGAVLAGLEGGSDGVTFDTLISALLRSPGVQAETTAFKPLRIRSSIFQPSEGPLNEAAGRKS